jgi:hypothetical protein
MAIEAGRIAQRVRQRLARPARPWNERAGAGSIRMGYQRDLVAALDQPLRQHINDALNAAIKRLRDRDFGVGGEGDVKRAHWAAR